MAGSMSGSNEQVMNRVLNILLPVGVALGVLLMSRTAPFQSLENITTDARFASFPRPDLADTNIVMVAIDNGSLDLLAGYGLNWPWSRDVYARAIQILDKAGVHSILFDLLFFDADIDRYETDSERTDSQFARALALSPRSVLAAELIPGRDGRFADARLPHWRFMDSLRFVGATNLVPDPGGVVRHIDLWHDLGGGPFPSIALAARMATDSAEFRRLYEPARHRIHWYGAPGPEGTFRYIPFSAILFASEDSLAFLRGKTVVIGAYASGLLDFKATPMASGGAYPGMEIWATVLSNLSQDDFIRPWPVWAEWLLLTGMGLLTVFLFRVPSVGWSILGVVSANLVVIVFALVIWDHLRIMMPVTGPILVSVLTHASVAAISYVQEGRARREIRAIFSRYVHPDVVESLTASPNNIRMGGDLAQATILFTDIDQFTQYAEGKAPNAVVTELNGYLSDLAEIVLDEGGLLDKFTGDGIMALFGVPVARADHAQMACHAALKHLAYSRNPDASRSDTQSRFHRSTRIGINSGDIIAGNIGSARRMDFTAIGDEVNLAGRLEGVNKIYGTRILLGENTRALLGPEFIVREIDSITVMGKTKAIRIFELVGLAGDSIDLDGIKTYETALEMYRRGEFEEAGVRFRSLSDEASAVMADRCEQLITAPRTDWNGVYNLTTK
jgi:adenylate cyclase